MFTTLIVQPIFNLLVAIYAILPGHNFGLAIVVFTIIVRLLMWPLVKKQLYHAKAMRELQPEIKRIKQETKGDRQKESAMIMTLYKERKINPFSSIGILIVQLPILIGLYSGLKRIIDNPNAIVDFSYGFIQNLGWVQELSTDISKFDNSLFGIVDLARAAINNGGGVYIPAMIIVIASAAIQYFQTKQLSPDDGNERSLRKILKDAGKGEEADPSEVNAATGRAMRYVIPVMIFFFTVNIASALSLYWFVSGLVAFMQQSYILNKEEELLEAAPDSVKTRVIIDGEVVSESAKKTSKTKNTPGKGLNKKRT
jgi:YidC/Oxa1 family membrane protein insertase